MPAACIQPALSYILAVCSTFLAFLSSVLYLQVGTWPAWEILQVAPSIFPPISQ